eukprot:gene4212-765_t
MAEAQAAVKALVSRKDPIGLLHAFVGLATTLSALAALLHTGSVFPRSFRIGGLCCGRGQDQHVDIRSEETNDKCSELAGKRRPAGPVSAGRRWAACAGSITLAIVPRSGVAAVSEAFEPFAETHSLAFPPVVCGGAAFTVDNSLDFSSQQPSDRGVNEDPTTLCVLGVKHKDVTAVVARTYIVEPPPLLTAAYKALYIAHEAASKKLVSGTTVSEVYAAFKEAMEKVSTEKDSILSCLPSTLGYCLTVGEAAQITADSTHKVNTGDLWFLCCAIRGLPVESTKEVLLIGDTVQVAEAGPTFITTANKLEPTYGNITYTFQSSSSEERKQLELMDNKAAEPATFSEGKRTDMKDHSEAKSLMKGQVYLSDKDFPVFDNRLQLMVSGVKRFIMVPFNGSHVLIALSAVRGAAMADEQGVHVLRLQLYCPAYGKENFTPAREFPNAAFIKEITLRSRKQSHLEHLMTTLKKHAAEIRQLDKKKAEQSDIVEQAQLQATGTLELHANGLQYIPLCYQSDTVVMYRLSGGDPKDNVRVVFENIRYVIFHPAKNDLFVMLHFHLKNPIMVRDKKTSDITIYTEVMEEATTLKGSAMRYTSEMQEMREEVAQDQFVKKLNTEFLHFVQKVQKHCEAKNFRFTLEIPGATTFDGSPQREIVTVHVSNNTLFSLQQPPAYVICWDDVELVQFERVILGLSKNFDMTILFKNYDRAPAQGWRHLLSTDESDNDEEDEACEDEGTESDGSFDPSSSSSEDAAAGSDSSEQDDSDSSAATVSDSDDSGMDSSDLEEWARQEDEKASDGSMSEDEDKLSFVSHSP